MTGANEKESWEVAFRGLQRFYDEGMTKWSWKNFSALFPSEDIAASEYVKGKLLDLVAKNAVTFVGRDDVFLIINKI